MPPPLRIFALVAGGLALAPARAAASEARCWYENGAVVVAGAFGDIAGDFIVDSTAPKSLLHDDVAQGAGFADTHLVDDLRFGGLRARRVALDVESFNEREVGFPTVIVGVIGADVLSRYVVRITYNPCRLELLTRPPRPALGALRLRLRIVGGVPAVAATATDGTRQRGGWWAVDTASAGLRLEGPDVSFAPPLAEGVDPTLRFRPPARLHGLRLDNASFDNTPAGTAEYPLPGLTGAIGNAVWSRYRVTLDLRRRVLVLEPGR